MSLPKAVFLDTSVFAGQQYNYESVALTSFIDVAKATEMKILLPDPTSREVERQLKARSAEALKALDDARRKAPFLAKWEYFPKKHEHSTEWTVAGIARREWLAFLGKLQVVKLGYDGVSIKRIMNWYDQCRAPFGEGKKRKEFPDALAMEIVSLYADKHGVSIAVVSEDQDIKKACEYYSSLLYFQSLGKLTEFLLNRESRLNELKEILDGDLGILLDAIHDLTREFQSHIPYDEFDEEERLIGPPEFTEFRVVGLGNNECTVVFEAQFTSEHKIVWEEIVDKYEGYAEKRSEWTSQFTHINGSAKLEIDTLKKVVSGVGMLELGESEIEIDWRPRAFYL